MFQGPRLVLYPFTGSHGRLTGFYDRFDHVLLSLTMFYDRFDHVLLNYDHVLLNYDPVLLNYGPPSCLISIRPWDPECA